MTVRLSHVGVVIPAHNEEREIDRCVRAATAAVNACRAERPDINFSIWCIADSCTDDTAATVRHLMGENPDVHLVQASYRSPGPTRDLGIRRFIDYCARTGSACDASTTWIAMTDADTVVPVHWLIDQVAAAESGVHAVVGTVQPRVEEIGELGYRLWRERHDFREGHSHVFGANLGVLLGAYQAVGGFLPLEHSEDVTLVDALEKAGFTLLKTDRVRAVTSARTEGRVRHGFSTYISDLLRENGLAGDSLPQTGTVETDPAE